MTTETKTKKTDSIKSLVQKTVSRTVDKRMEIKPDMVGDLIKKAVGAPAETVLVPGTAKDGTPIHILEWSETPKPRAARKVKADAPAA